MAKYGGARQAKGDIIVQCMHIAHWIAKATDTHSECVIGTAVPQQHILCLHPSMLCVYVRCLSCLPLSVTSIWKSEMCVTCS